MFGRLREIACVIALVVLVMLGAGGAGGGEWPSPLFGSDDDNAFDSGLNDVYKQGLADLERQSLESSHQIWQNYHQERQNADMYYMRQQGANQSELNHHERLHDQHMNHLNRMHEENMYQLNRRLEEGY